MTQTMTQTEVATEPSEIHLFSEKLDEKYANTTKLTREQCGHVRHFHNLASQLDGEWSLMGSQEPGQEWDTAYRYQISAMTYAAGAAYYHRLPAMRSMFKPLMRKLIHKMLRREVWGYWYLSSQSGIRIDPDLKELRKPWANPVCKENVMYSGHILLMVSLYSMLFDDHEFDEVGSIVFDWNPLFYGMGQEVFKYSKATLQQTVLAEMERENWMGACCEPNMVFIICNQFPIIATRYNDVLNQTNTVDEVLKNYKAAWAKRGMVSENGLFRRCYRPGRDEIMDADNIGHSAWTMAFMPWNYAQVQSMYPSSGIGFLHRTSGRINIHPPTVAHAIKSITKKDSRDPDSPTVIHEARSMAKTLPPTIKLPYLGPTFGHVAQWLSEVAAPADLNALLRHADVYLNPRWRDGGLFYARCDNGWDEEGNYTYMEPYTGNAAIGYARLNVKNGQKIMWDHPWTKEEVEKQPWIDGVGLEQSVDCLRGQWDEEGKFLQATFRTWNGEKVRLRPVVKNLRPGQYGIYVDGELQEVKSVRSSVKDVLVDLTIGSQEVDLVVLCA